MRTGQPVGSKTIVQRTEMGVSSSTVRSELSTLEGLGLLTHPHTSAGRLPTEEGYREYAAELLDRLEPRPAAFPLELPLDARGEVDSALQATTEMLSQVTRLLALVSAPPAETTTIRHVEVLLLQTHVVVVVAITSTGAVSKRIVAFDEPIDQGLVSWAGQYLNEQLVGRHPGVRTLRRCFDDDGLTRREHAFLDLLRPAFTELASSEERRLFVGGAGMLLDEVRVDELAAYRRLLDVLERRAALLDVLGRSLDQRRPFVRVGDREHPALRELALVGAAYGLANRTLGAVSLVGPVRMDYEKAVRSVRSAARELSRVVETIYAED